MTHWTSINFFRLLAILGLTSLFPAAQAQHSNLTYNDPPFALSETSFSETNRMFAPQILAGFDKISQDFQNLARVFDNKDEELKDETVLSRVARELPVNRHPQCTVSEDKLKQLLNEIKTTLSNAGSTGTNNCVLDYNANRCAEMIKMIQCGVNHLKNGYIEANQRSDGAASYEKLRVAYNELTEKFNRIRDDVQRAVSQEDQQKMDKLTNDIQDLRTTLSNSIDSARKKSVQLVIQYIELGKISNAKSEFESLNDDTVLREIIRSVYLNYGGSDKVNFMVRFMSSLFSCSSASLATTWLYDVMKEKPLPHTLNSPEFLIFSKYVSSSNCPNSAFKSEVAKRADNIAEAVGNKIVDHDSEARNFGKNHGEVFRFYLEKMIRSAYRKNLWRAEKIITFLDGFGADEKKIAYPVLFKIMKESNGLNGHELIMLVYRVKELHESLPSDNRGGLSDVVYALSGTGIRRLLWDTYIYVKSKKLGNRLGWGIYYSGFIIMDKHYDLRTCPDSESEFDYKWRVTSPNKGVHFKLKSDDYDRPLYINNIDNNDDQLWQIIPVDNAQYFYFKHKATGKLLDSNNLAGFVPSGYGVQGFGVLTYSISSKCSQVYGAENNGINDHRKWEIL